MFVEAVERSLTRAAVSFLNVTLLGSQGLQAASGEGLRGDKIAALKLAAQHDSELADEAEKARAMIKMTTTLMIMIWMMMMMRTRRRR